jgi:general stress protein 26
MATNMKVAGRPAYAMDREMTSLRTEICTWVNMLMVVQKATACSNGLMAMCTQVFSKTEWSTAKDTGKSHKIKIATSMKANTFETRNTATVSLGGPVEVYIAEPTKKISNTVMERWFGLTAARIAANGYKGSKKA